jgi:hypothetical protein
VTPAISVVLPTYNHLRFLRAAIADILGQTRRDFELIVVNDGSTDGPREWLDAQHEPRLRKIHQDNAGPDQAINTGIRAATGEYLTWVSADNRCTPYFLEALAAPLDLDPACTIAYSPYYAIDEHDRIVAVKFDNLLLLRELVTGTPRGMAGFLHDAVGLYQGFACDTLMWSRLVESYAAVFVLEPTYYYRFHDDRATVRESGRVEVERSAIATGFLKRHGGTVDAAVLQRLYPGLACAPALATDAAADFAARLSRCGLAEPGLRVALTALAGAGVQNLLRPLANAVGAATCAGIDPLPEIWQALEANPALEESQRDTALSIAAGLATLAQQGGGAPALMLELGHALSLLERPKVFSYASWKTGQGVAPLPAF